MFNSLNPIVKGLETIRLSLKIDSLFALVIAPLIAIATSYPPTLPEWIFTLIDYPVFRLILYGIVMVGAFIAPLSTTVIGVGLAIIIEDIMKLVKDTENFQTTVLHSQTDEGFQQKEIPAENETLPEKAGRKASEPFTTALDHIRQAEQAIQTMLRGAQKIR